MATSPWPPATEEAEMVGLPPPPGKRLAPVGANADDDHPDTIHKAKPGKSTQALFFELPKIS